MNTKVKSNDAILAIASLLIGTVCFTGSLLYFPQWRGAVAGLCAGLTIVAGFWEYFVLPKQGDKIKAPNPWQRRPAGILAAFSAILWIVSAIPN